MLFQNYIFLFASVCFEHYFFCFLHPLLTRLIAATVRTLVRLVVKIVIIVFSLNCHNHHYPCYLYCHSHHYYCYLYFHNHHYHCYLLLQIIIIILFLIYPMIRLLVDLFSLGVPWEVETSVNATCWKLFNVFSFGIFSWQVVDIFMIKQCLYSFPLKYFHCNQWIFSWLYTCSMETEHRRIETGEKRKVWLTSLVLATLVINHYQSSSPCA